MCRPICTELIWVNLEYYYTTDNGSCFGTLLGNLSGDQGDNWIEVNVDISSLAGEPNVQFKFTGKTGDGYLSDIAIDELFMIKDNEPDYCAASGNMNEDTADQQRENR